MITLQEYLMGRDKTHPEEYAAHGVKENAEFLLHQVNTLLGGLGLVGVEVRSGWRPKEINEKVGGAPRSAHLVGRAIDIADPLGGLYAVLEQNPEKLRALQLWMESRKRADGTFITKTWCHLDNIVRRDRPSRIFLP